MLNTTDVRGTAKLPSAALPLGASWQSPAPRPPAPCSKLFALPYTGMLPPLAHAAAYSVCKLLELWCVLANRDRWPTRRLKLPEH